MAKAHNLYSLGQGWLDEGAWDEFVSEILDSNDRAAAILAVNFLDQNLEQCLRDLLPAHDGCMNLDRIFRDNGLLQSLDSKIKLSRAMAIIGDETSKNLTIIVRIRNRFAHSLHPLTFSTPAISEACKNLAVLKVEPLKVEPLLESPRGKFIAASISTSLALKEIVFRRLSMRLKSAEAKHNEWLVGTP